MTAKRFVSEDNCCGYYTEIIDNEKELDLSLPNPKKNLTIEELVDLLNELHEENSLLKDIIKDIVIKLEANYTSNTYEMTIPINRVIYNELRRRLKETSFNEELRRFLDD